MFTGLIEELGAVKDLTQAGGNHRITISAPKLASELKTGDSVAVNGVCLTALDLTTDSFAADLAAETVERTALTRLRPGTAVNLELPTRAGAPLGGHVVQGHVDGLGTIVHFNRRANADDWQLIIALPAGLERYVVPQGSLAIEGISLTVAQVASDQVTIAIIPHTYAVTNLRTLKAGDVVNVEVDVLAKYAERRHSTRAEITAEEIIRQGF
jgi:riboflavin synthase